MASDEKRTIGDIQRSFEMQTQILEMLKAEQSSALNASILPMMDLNWYVDVRLLLQEIDRLVREADRLSRLVRPTPREFHEALARKSEGEMLIRIKVSDHIDPTLTDPEDIANDIVDTFTEDLRHRTSTDLGSVELVSAEWRQG